MTSKERAGLRRDANGLETIYQVGKNEIDETLIKGVGEALKARELIKLRVQDNADYSAKEAAAILAEKLKAEVIQVIGSKFVLYKRNKDINKYGVK
jgi:Predicted RNA-binding protein containing KH domain, possibly ribosomal protein